LNEYVAARPVVARPLTASFSASSTSKKVDDDVVIPEISDTLEWTLSSPPPIHQFDESPIIVETYGPTDPHAH